MIYLELFWAFFKIGLFGFGGGMAIIGLIYENIRLFAAIDQYQFADIVAISQTTPGPVAVNAATYVGYLSGGIKGSVTATLGVAIPAFIIVCFVAYIMERHQSNKYIIEVINEVKPATVSMVAVALITMSKPAFFTDKMLGANIFNFEQAFFGRVDIIAVIIAISTIIAIGKFKISPVKVMIAMGIAGALLGV